MANWISKVPIIVYSFIIAFWGLHRWHKKLLLTISCVQPHGPPWSTLVHHGPAPIQVESALLLPTPPIHCWGTTRPLLPTFPQLLSGVSKGNTHMNTNTQFFPAQVTEHVILVPKNSNRSWLVFPAWYNHISTFSWTKKLIFGSTEVYHFKVKIREALMKKNVFFRALPKLPLPPPLPPMWATCATFFWTSKTTF